jgi:hypothetical protein
MPWFWSDIDPSDIESCVTAAAATQLKTVLRSIHPDLFGPDKDIPVHVLEKNQELEALHMDIYNALNDLGSYLYRTSIRRIRLPATRIR